MIKTVSFAPPRAAHSRSSAKISKTKSAQIPILISDGPAAIEESAAPDTSLAKPKTKKATPKPQSEVSLDLFGGPDEPVAPLAALSKPAGKAKSTKNQDETEIKAKAEVKAPKSGEIKAKKARVPKDLAAQYGEKTANRPVAVPLEIESPKRRLNKAERQARRDLMKPSESLMERLARANQIPQRKAPSEPRGKGWKFACGRCGTTSYFQTPGGVCACGTIALKE